MTKTKMRGKEYLETPGKMRGGGGRHYKNINVQIKNEIKIQYYFKELEPYLCKRRTNVILASSIHKLNFTYIVIIILFSVSLSSNRFNVGQNTKDLGIVSKLKANFSNLDNIKAEP